MNSDILMLSWNLIMEFDDGKSGIKIVFGITKRVHNKNNNSNSINLTTSSIVILLLLY